LIQFEGKQRDEIFCEGAFVLLLQVAAERGTLSALAAAATAVAAGWAGVAYDCGVG